MPKLKPPKNFGVRTPEVCALCRWFEATPDGAHWRCHPNAVTLVRGALNALLLGLLVEPAALNAAWGGAAGWAVSRGGRWP